MRVFRRHDIAQVRVVARPADAPLILDIVHIDLYFFFDVDLVMLEPRGQRLPTSRWRRPRNCCIASAAPTRPSGMPTGRRCTAWRAWNGSARMERCWRAPTRTSATFLALRLRASRPAHRGALGLPAAAAGERPLRAPGLLRFRQIEYYRMPLMGYLALDDPRALTRNDFVRLGLVTGAARSMQRAALCRGTTWATSSNASATTGSGPRSGPRRTRATCAAAMP